MMIAEGRYTEENTGMIAGMATITEDATGNIKDLTTMGMNTGVGNYYHLYSCKTRASEQRPLFVKINAKFDSVKYF